MTDLSHRQAQVLRRLATGKTRIVVAHELGLNPSTVKGHVSAAFRKLGVTTLVEGYAKLGWLVPLAVDAAYLEELREDELASAYIQGKLDAEAEYRATQDKPPQDCMAPESHDLWSSGHRECGCR